MNRCRLDTPETTTGIPLHEPVHHNPSVDTCDAHRENPARLSPLLTRLFPPGVVGTELWIGGDSSTPAETRRSGDISLERAQEVNAGRLCARRALAELGYAGNLSRVNGNRRPHLPSAVVGSISYAAGMCGAVVANQQQLRAIGLDIERVGHVIPEVWPYICTPEEIAWLATLSEPEQDRCAALIFSAKESFYKCQYSVAQQCIELNDVTLEFFFHDAESGWYVVRPRGGMQLPDHGPTPSMGRFEFYRNIVVTGMALELC